MKSIFGVFLLPVAWIWTVSFAGLLGKEAFHGRFWQEDRVRFVAVGAVLWLFVFFGGIAVRGEPWMRRWYVLGHEAAHAVWAWLCLGRVDGFDWGPEGGYVLTNKPNFWVTLAPYFYPVYSVLLMVLFQVIYLFYPFPDEPGWILSPMQIFLILIGGSWSFHISFTVWMIHKGQSDLRMHGNFFSIVLIYIMNVALISLHLALALPDSGFRKMKDELQRNTEDFCDAAWRLGVRAWHAARR